MYLFFNGVSTHWYIALLSKSKDIIESENFSIAGNESSKAWDIIESFLRKQQLTYTDIQNIICVIGPWSFTAVRTISLVINTLAYCYKQIEITPVNFFDLYSEYPIVKSSSKRDLFVKMDESAIIEVMTNIDFENRCEKTKIFWDTNMCRFEKDLEISDSIKYDELCKNIILQNNKRIAPLYIKKPNIS